MSDERDTPRLPAPTRLGARASGTTRPDWPPVISPVATTKPPDSTVDVDATDAPVLLLVCPKPTETNVMPLPYFELVLPLRIVLSAIALDGQDAITTTILRIPSGTRIPGDSPAWRWRSDLVWTHYSSSPVPSHQHNAAEWSLRALRIDKAARGVP